MPCQCPQLQIDKYDLGLASHRMSKDWVLPCHLHMQSMCVCSHFFGSHTNRHGIAAFACSFAVLMLSFHGAMVDAVGAAVAVALAAALAVAVAVALLWLLLLLCLLLWVWLCRCGLLACCDASSVLNVACACVSLVACWFLLCLVLVVSEGCMGLLLCVCIQTQNPISPRHLAEWTTEETASSVVASVIIAVLVSVFVFCGLVHVWLCWFMLLFGNVALRDAIAIAVAVALAWRCLFTLFLSTLWWSFRLLLSTLC